MADVGRDDLELIERIALARVVVVARLREAPWREAVVVEDDQRAGLQHRHADLQCGRVERDQDVGRIARGRDRIAAEIDLVRGYPEGRAGRRTDLRRVVGEGGEVVARQRRRHRELRAHQLDSVAGIAGKTHDDGL